MNNLQSFQLEKKKAEKFVKMGIPMAIIGAAAFVLLGQYGFFGALLVFPGIILIGIGTSNFSKLSRKFKTEVLIDLISTYVDNGQFIPDRGLDIGTVYSTEFVKRADRYHTEDYLSGSMEGVNFISSDVKLEEKHVEHTKDGTRTYYETYFLGRIFVFDFNKQFDGSLQVLEHGSPVSHTKYAKVKLESVVFNKKFKTYTTNDHSAFYVLTPHFMEALMKFEQNNKGSISFSFIKNSLYIGINNFKDTFELKMFKKLDDSLFEEFKRDLMVINEVITELKLNRNIFK